MDDADDKSLVERMKITTTEDAKLPCTCHAFSMVLLFPAVIMFSSDSVKGRVIKQHIVHRLCLINSAADYPTEMFGLGTASSGIFGRSRKVDIANLRLCIGEFMYDHFMTCGSSRPLNLRGIITTYVSSEPDQNGQGTLILTSQNPATTAGSHMILQLAS